MKLLIIEDDNVKYASVVDFINTHISKCNIEHARSYNSGLRAAIKDKYDYILLDMTLPTYDVDSSDDGGTPLPYAGREILRQLDRKQIDNRVVILTQFDSFGSDCDAKSLVQLIDEIKECGFKNYVAYVFYSALTDNWKNELYKILTDNEVYND